MSFDKLGLSEKILSAVNAAGFEKPTLIQEKAIPVALEGRDVLGIAQTGTGKTAAFALPMLARLEKGRARARMPRTLILEPTRELAAQVEEAFNNLGKNHKLNVALLIGGVSFTEQNKKLDRGADVLIATPGRLLDHFERGRLLMNGVEVLVIDEADRMLDMGFIPDVERICKMIPFTRQTLFFSATMPSEIQRLVDTFLHNPVRIEAGRPSTAAETVNQLLVKSNSEAKAKRETLRNIFQTQKNLTNAIIFCNRKRDVAILHRSLVKHGFNAGCLHGDMDQRARMAMLASFRDGEITYLVASDVAARGLDIPNVSHVFNYDVPTHAEDYIHRIGRTGRAGRQGDAMTIVTKAEKKYLDAILALTGQEIPWNDEQPEPGEEAPPGADQERGRERSRSKKGKSGDKKNTDQRVIETDSRKNSDPENLSENTAEKFSDNTSENTKKHAEKGADTKPNHSGARKSQIKGMGNHTPAFLLRPIKPRKE